MRLNKSHEIDAFLKSPAKGIEAVVFHGGDQGLVRERAALLEKSVLGPNPGPFQKTDFGDGDLRGAPGRLAEEMGAVTMLGGRKFIRVRCSADVAAAALAFYLKERDTGAPAPDGLACFEAGELKATQALRKLAEGDKRAAGILCAPDTPASLEDFIRTRLKLSNLSADAAALAALTERLAGDRGMAARELDKLELYMQGAPAADIREADIRAVMGPAPGGDLDDIVEAAFIGDLAALGAALEEARTRGIDAQRLLRASSLFADRLARRLAGQRTPMPYAHEQALARISGRWTPGLAARARTLLLEALVMVGRPDAPADAIGERALVSIANAARR